MTLTKADAERYLEPGAQSIEDRYMPAASRMQPGYLSLGTDSELARMATRCEEFHRLNYSSGTLQEEQERELSPENESERQVQEAALAKPIKHFLHADIVIFALTA
ncbi:hypothetical protein B0A48_18902 [Cryoendolithus antarcticus]|uniref:Uncharacterized protein n=1 Tax=Cryoendolithus antarcticus TaxID=1507870 RepID=A0A1V8S7V6_9PEZI|nr:hypothetical protein B0A48_18902 [Cryoendolithus antarcticus]OQO15676.1 hypothetical protein B0A51_18914 [Rachicladosporium sp. CCFEE 5018]